MHTLQRLFVTSASYCLAISLVGCIEPKAEVIGAGSQLPTNAPPDSHPYQCTSASGSACVAPRARYWLAGWKVTKLAARDHRVAFTAEPIVPEGTANLPSPPYLGQINLNTGIVDWLFPIGNAYPDVLSIYDLKIAPHGDVLVGATGYGELLLGEKVSEFDGFVASFDVRGNKRFARRLEIFDEIPPPPNERPRLTNLQINDQGPILVLTGFQVTKPNAPTVVPVHLFAFTTEGRQIFRQEVPIAYGSYAGAMWPVPDGSVWIKTFPGAFYHYSNDAELLHTFELAPTVDMRGFAAMESTSLLINLTTKGMTNELYRLHVGEPLTALFAEATPPQFHAAFLEHTLGLSQTYFVEMNYSGLTYRFAPIDKDGKRGLVTTLDQVTNRYTLLDNGDGVFCRVAAEGTEFIVQSL